MAARLPVPGLIEQHQASTNDGEDSSMGEHKRDISRDFEEHKNVDGGTSTGARLGAAGRGDTSRSGAGDAGESAARDRDDTGTNR
jgi:hypothetical protein